MCVGLDILHTGRGWVMSKPVVSRNEEGYLEVSNFRVTERTSVHKRRTPTRLKVYQMTHEFGDATLDDLRALRARCNAQDLKEIRVK